MKKYLLTLILILIFSIKAQAFFIYPPHPFCDAVDKAWRQDKEKDIIKMVNERLKEKKDDPLALAIGSYYYCFVEMNIDKGEVYYKKLIKKSENYGIEEIIRELSKDLSEAFKEENKKKLKPFTEKQKRAVKDIFPDAFPGTMQSFMIAKMFIPHDKVFTEEASNLYVDFQNKKKKIVMEIGGEKLRRDVDIIFEKLSQDDREKLYYYIPKELWTTSINKLEPQTVIKSGNGLIVAFIKFVNNIDGIYIYSEKEELKGHKEEEKSNRISEGIYWYSKNN